MEELLNSFDQTIKDARIAASMIQDALAAQTGVTPRYIMTALRVWRKASEQNVLTVIDNDGGTLLAVVFLKLGKELDMGTILMRRERSAENIISIDWIFGMVPISSAKVITRLESLPPYSSATVSISR